MGWKRKIAAGAAVAAIQCSNVPRYIFLHDRDSCVIVKNYLREFVLSNTFLSIAP